MAYTGTTPGMRPASGYTGTRPRGFSTSSVRKPRLPGAFTNGAADPGQPPPAYPGGGGPPQPKKPGLLEVPGSYEQWYQGYKQRPQDPNRRTSYWNGVQGKVAGGGRIGSAYDAYKGTLSGPRQGVQGARDAASYFTMPGQGESWVRQNQSQFDGPGVAENNYGNVQRTLGGIRYGDSAVRDTQQGVKGAQRTASYFDNTLSQYSGGNGVADEYEYFAPGLREKSYSETAYESGAGGLIDPYQRTMDKSIRAARDASAARGQFNSDRGMAMEREVTADIAAEEARDRIALAGQADQARLGRTGAALDFSSAAEEAGRGRRELGLRGAMGADEGARDNLGLMQDAYGMASDEALKKVGLETDAAELSQRAMIDRLMSGGKFGLMADEAGQRRAKTGAEIGLAADEEERALADALLRGAGYSDQQDMDWMTRGMGLAGNADDGERQDLRDAADFADRDQERFEGRLRGGLNDIRSAAAEQFNALMGQLDQASQRYFQDQKDAIQAEVDGGRITQQEGQQREEELLASIANFVRTRQAPAGAPK